MTTSRASTLRFTQGGYIYLVADHDSVRRPQPDRPEAVMREPKASGDIAAQTEHGLGAQVNRSAAPGPDRSTRPAAARAGDTVQAVRQELRDAILRGDLAAGEAVTSVGVAERFGVSRTPAREALRMLQEEGFLRGSSNQRLRVVEWSPEELESVFAQRILISALCTKLTVPNLTDADISRMEHLMTTMDAARVSGDQEGWRLADVEFHDIHLRGASDTMRADLARLYERAWMFRTMWLRNRDLSLSFNLNDHPDILEACRLRRGDLAGAAEARHLTRVALTLMTELAPDVEPATVREALRLAGVERLTPTRTHNGEASPSGDVLRGA
jgi:DNA-binding GntR family transcriptional regulator